MTVTDTTEAPTAAEAVRAVLDSGASDTTVAALLTDHAPEDVAAAAVDLLRDVRTALGITLPGLLDALDRDRPEPSRGAVVTSAGDRLATYMTGA